MKRRFLRVLFSDSAIPDGRVYLASAAVTSLLGLVDGLSHALLIVLTCILSLIGGRWTKELRHSQYIFAILVAAGLLFALLLGGLTIWINVLLLQFATVLLPWWAGSWWQQRTLLLRAGWARAEQLQREKVLAAEQARLRERARIAQDMHDSLGHELSLMALVAGGLELSPELGETHRATAARLRAGAVAATERLHEIIGLLGERHEEPTGTADEDIAALVERARLSGVPVVLERDHRAGAAGEDEAEEWPPATRHAARRVVQESLTNAVKHAPGGPIRVRVEDSADEAVITVVNGPPTETTSPASVRGGTGLISLDERTRLAGGSLRAGPHGEGFEVVARLPRVPPPAVGEREAPKERSDPPEDLAGAARQVRRHLLLVSTLPLAAAAALVGVLVTLYVLTVMTTSMEPSEFERIRVGQPRAELADMLSGGFSNPSPLLAEPPALRGAVCQYYRVDDNVFDLSNTTYRLCFDDGDVLVSKDTLHQR
ncbi:sensor histidine kinase [Streptomyces sp. SBT349]|uniref:sensor histidine kinase n=1 Tax=Streptomyces sp. SBT349 TaxID=1580539 RepID=UPI00066D9ED8|nr:histidine kinase [Streptomyces sp. SBT349]